MNAIATLVQEHRHIETALAALESFVAAVEAGASPAPLARFVEFFRGYADAHHHGKEERILFPALHRCSMPMDSGPLAVMLHDHGEGRHLVGVLSEGLRADDAEARSELARTARRYAALLRHHIYKEDTVLFSMVETLLSGDERARLEADVGAFERSNDPAPWLSSLRSLAQAFRAGDTYPDSSEPVGNGCDLHCSVAGCPIRDPFGELPWHEGA